MYHAHRLPPLNSETAGTGHIYGHRAKSSNSETKRFLEICIIILPETNSEFKIQPHMREILKFTSICLNTCYSPSLENVRITLEIMIFVVAKFPQLKQELNLDLYNQLITYLRDNNYQDVAEEALITIRNH